MEVKETVILHRRADLGRIYVFQNDGCWDTFNYAEITSFLKDVNTWYLADTLLSSPDGAKGTTILVSSPSEKHYSEFLKCSHVVPLHYLPIWSLEELKLMGPSYSRSEDVVKKRFNMIGGLPRYVLEKDDDLKEKVEEKINKLLSDKAALQIPLENLTESEISHRLIHFKVEPPCYTKPTRVLGSEYIRGRFSERLRDLDEQKARYFLRLFGDVSLVAASVGNLFQGYADRHLSAGGRFLIRSLDTEVDDSIDLSPRPIYLFRDLSECTNPAIYYRPKAKNFACIDSLILEVGYFQITISQKRDISIKEMKKIMETVDMEKLYFVVPHTKFEAFMKPKFKGSAENNNKDKVDEGTNTGKGNFPEDKSPNRDAKRQKTNRVDNNQSFQEDSFVKQFVLSIPIDEEIAGWLIQAEEAMPVLQQEGKGEEINKKEEEDTGKQEKGIDKKSKEEMAE